MLEYYNNSVWLYGNEFKALPSAQLLWLHCIPLRHNLKSNLTALIPKYLELHNSAEENWSPHLSLLLFSFILHKAPQRTAEKNNMTHTHYLYLWHHEPVRKQLICAFPMGLSKCRLLVSASTNYSTGIYTGDHTKWYTRTVRNGPPFTWVYSSLLKFISSASLSGEKWSKCLK